MARAVAALGILVGTVFPESLVAGHLHLDLHGFGIVVFAQSAWLIWVGVLLCRRQSASPAA